MPGIENDRDDQDQSETFDETHIDDEGDGDILLEDAEDVLDVTQAEGDADEDDFDEDDTDLEALQALDGIEAEADDLLGLDRAKLAEIDSESGGQTGPGEVELVYTGLMRNVRGAQASAAHWEAKRLSDDDISGLGYGPAADEDQEIAR